MTTSTKDLSQHLLATLPYLRRYARALTGSQAQGDEWVRLCVEVLLQQPELLHAEPTTKAGIFQLFHRLQRPFSALDRSAGTGDPSLPANRLEVELLAIPDMQRSVLLLNMLEDFSIDEAGYILGITTQDASQALHDAREGLWRRASVRVLIIEDEAVIALDVAQIVRSAGHQVVGIAASEHTAIELATKHAPDLVIADIQLKHGDDGRAAVREILKSMSVPVIFVTGFPERLLTGEGVEPAFVITKPFAADQLKMAIAQALSVTSV
jgi:CheY-like chemotaxis protein/DNA-directed RNA polymerase specialized sigma24 family protein